MYEDRAVLFMDILGFKNLVKTQEADRVLHALQRIQAFVKIFSPNGEDPRMTTFSDCIVISAPLAHGDGVKRLGVIACMLWLDLLGVGVLARGAITCGPLYHAENIVFGQAMIDAYMLESKKAIFPRIIVTPELQETLLNRHGHTIANSAFDIFPQFDEIIRQDYDGLFHLDMFHPLVPKPPVFNHPDMIDDFIPPRSEIHGHFSKTVFNILTYLKAEGYPSEAEEKFLWLAQYYLDSYYRFEWKYPVFSNLTIGHIA